MREKKRRRTREEAALIKAFARAQQCSERWARALADKNEKSWQDFIAAGKKAESMAHDALATDESLSDLERARIAKERAWDAWLRADDLAKQAENEQRYDVLPMLNRAASTARQNYEAAKKFEDTLRRDERLYLPISAVRGIRDAMPQLTDMVRNQRMAIAGRLPQEARREFYAAYDASRAAWNAGISRIEAQINALFPSTVSVPLLDGLLLTEREVGSEWVEKNLIFPRGTSPNNPGPVSFSRQPYMREPIDACLDPEVKDIYLSWGSQTGKTAALICMAGIFIGLEPMNVIWTLTSDGLCRTFSNKRLIPFIEANPILKQHVLEDDPASLSPLEYKLDNMDLVFTGVSSPGRVSSNPVSVAIMDEEAKYPWIDKAEAPPVNLITERTKGFARRLHIHASTPNAVDNHFWQGFVSSDMREYFMPCPHCGELMTFEFSVETVIWDKPAHGVDLDLAEQTARYICPHCRGEIRNEQKFAMMLAGKWMPSEKLRREYGDDEIAVSASSRGYHINSLYSPYVTFGQYARAFLECLQKITVQTELQNLKNGWEGLPYEFLSVQTKNDHIRALCGKYQRGCIPAAEWYYIGVSYDPGGDQTHWVAYAIGERGEMWVIDWGTILNFTTKTHLENKGTDEEPEWETVVDSPGIAPHFSGLEWQGHRPDMGFVDAGYETMAIYNECAMMPGVLVPTKGSPAKTGTWYERPSTPVHPGQTVVNYIDHTAKMALYSESIVHGRGFRLHLPQDADEELIRGLSGQKLVKKPSGAEWKKVPGDHYGDCVKTGHVSWWVLGRRFEDPAILLPQNEPPAPDPETPGTSGTSRT